MLATRITPKIVLGACAVALAAVWLARRTPHLGGLRGADVAQQMGAFIALLTAALACWLCLVIAAEHRQARRMQWAWWLLAANAGFGVLRAVLESVWGQSLFTNVPLRGLLLQFVIFPANICLLLGCVAMWRAFRGVGLPVRLKLLDGGLLVFIGTLAILLLLFRAGFSEAASPYLLARYSQTVGLSVFVGYGVLGVILYRMAEEMGGGPLARALRCLVVYMLLRGTIFLLSSAYAVLNRKYGWPELGVAVGTFNDTAAQVVRWLPLLTATYRLQMSAEASRKLRHLRQSQPAPAALAND